MKLGEDEQLAKVAYLYYIEDLDQVSIAKQLDIHRSTVSRMIKKAREKGIVDIRINDFDEELFELERKVRGKYGLHYVEVVSNNTNDKEELGNLIGERASQLLHQVVNDGDNVGFSWGSSLAYTVKNLEQKYTEDTVFVPLVGGSTQVDTNNHVNTLVYELSRKFHGESIYANANVIQESPELAAGIVSSTYFEELIKYWNELDLAFVGIGGHSGMGGSTWREVLTQEDWDTLEKEKIVGDCCCRFFDADGKILEGNLYDRTIGISLEQLKKTPLTVGVAFGDDKVLAVRAALENGYINSIVTDERTLKKVLEY